jgi:hypothetical protein
MLNVTGVRYLRDFVLWLRFSDGAEGEIDLSTEIWGEVFEPVRDREYFARVAVSSEIGTIAWPNGADFAPEFLRERIRIAA